MEPGNPLHELIATVALIRSPSRPAPMDRLGSLIDHCGSAVELAQLNLEDVLFTVPEADVSLAGTVTDDLMSEAARDVDRWRASGVDIRSVLDAHYPANLHGVFDRPPLVFVKGSLRAMEDRRSIAVVGTRSATPQGLARATRLARELVEAGFTVVSGLAAGIDTAAHTAALDARGRTVAVMGTGLDHVAPASNRPLAARIVDAGCALLTQFFPEQTARPWMFPARNVVMSGLALATIVVEASETSGARMQARIALQHGRAVFMLRSLVDNHEWARRFVDEGIDGSRAVVIASTSEIVERFDAASWEPLRVSA